MKLINTLVFSSFQKEGAQYHGLVLNFNTYYIMVLLLAYKNNAMKDVVNSIQDKIRTTLYLTQENKQGLDRIPRGQKTALMNRAIANALKELEQKENNKKFLDMLSHIKPVKADLSSETMVLQLRSEDTQQNNDA